MTAEHVLFIPAVLLVGIVVGYNLGLRTARAQIEKRASRNKE